jgi:hypothetical protein
VRQKSEILYYNYTNKTQNKNSDDDDDDDNNNNNNNNKSMFIEILNVTIVNHFLVNLHQKTELLSR